MFYVITRKVLQVGEIFVSDGTETWDNEGCTEHWNSDASYPDIDTQLVNFHAWTKPNTYGLWHMFDDCKASSFMNACLMCRRVQLTPWGLLEPNHTG
jgi:hypothetical protein